MALKDAMGTLKDLYTKINGVKLPGGVTAWKFFVMTFVIFCVGSGVMFNVMKTRMIKAYKMKVLADATAHFQDLKTKGGAPQGDALTAATTGQALTPATTGQALATGTTVQLTATDQGLKELNRLSARELDERVVTFLLHAYEEQKVTIRQQDGRIAQLELAIAELRKGAKASEAKAPPAPAPEPVKAVKAPAPGDTGDDVKRLAELYSQMKPEEACAIAQDMDDATLVQVFDGMKSRSVAKIMALMDPKRAAKLSMMMTERK